MSKTDIKGEVKVRFEINNRYQYRDKGYLTFSWPYNNPKREKELSKVLSEFVTKLQETLDDTYE